MEEAVYICSWSHSSAGFLLWWRSRPAVRGSGATFAEAMDRLEEAIQDAGGAMHVVMEFDPQPPKTDVEERYGHPEIYVVGGDDRFQTDAPGSVAFETADELESRLRWLDGFYDQPVCRRCRWTSGRRNDRPLTLNYVSSRHDGAFGLIGTDGGPMHAIFSEEFLSLLVPEEKETLEFRPTLRRGRRKFFELLGPEGPPTVAVSTLPLRGWRCPKCDHGTWGHFGDGLSMRTYVARCDLPDPLPTVFTIGTYPEVALAVTGARWKEMLGRRGTRGFTSRAVGVVPELDVVRNPQLEILER